MRLILDCPDSVDMPDSARHLTDNQTRVRFFFTPIRTAIRTKITTTTRKSLIFHAPRVIRTPALLIRSHPSRRGDTLIRGVSRGDA